MDLYCNGLETALQAGLAAGIVNPGEPFVSAMEVAVLFHSSKRSLPTTRSGQSLAVGLPMRIGANLGGYGVNERRLWRMLYSIVRGRLRWWKIKDST